MEREKKQENKLNTAIVMSILDKVRKPETEKKMFSDMFPETWRQLHVTNHSSQMSFELLLIGIIMDLYGETKDSAVSENNKKDMARKRDFSLLMFGLLDGYRHTDIKKGIKVAVRSKERYSNYLTYSDYIKIDYHGEGTYKEIREKDKKRLKGKFKQDRPLNELSHIVSETKKEIADCLFDLIQKGEYERHIHREPKTIDIVFQDGKKEKWLELPAPYYTLKNFPSIEDEPEPPQPEPTTEEKKPKPTFIECIKAIKIPLIIVLVLIGMICIGVLCWRIGRNSSVPTVSQPANGSVPQGYTETVTETTSHLEIFGIVLYDKKTTETQRIETTVPIPLDE